MSFLNISALAFLSIIPLVVLLYFLKLKRTERVVSSTLLWKKIIDDMRVNSPFQRLKKNLLLFLQILILLLAILAIARPFMSMKGYDGQSVVLLIDTSGSMQSKDAGGKSRLDMAKERAVEIIDDLSRDDKMMIISFAQKARIIQSFTSSKSLLLKAMESIKAYDTQTYIKEALLIARSMVEQVNDPEVYVITDGAMEEISDLKVTQFQVQKKGLTKEVRTFLPKFIIVGKGSNNVGITAMDVRRYTMEDTNEEGFQVFAQVENFKKEPVELFVELIVNGQPIDEEIRKIKIDARDEDVNNKQGVSGILFSSPRIKEGVVEVNLSIKDALAIDNKAWAVVEKTKNPRILLVSGGNYFLQKVLFSHDPTLAKRGITSPSQYEKEVSSAGRDFFDSYDIVIFDGYNPSSPLPESGSYMFFNALPNLPQISESGEVKDDDAAFIDQNQSHPAMRFVNMEGVNVAKAKKIKLPGSAVVLLEAKDTPLIASISKQNAHYVIVGFDIYNSDWPLSLSFPIFIANTINWFMEKQSELERSHSSGEIISIKTPQEIKEVSITDPSGKEHNIKVESGRQAYFSETNQIGVYNLKIKGKEDRKFVVNLLSSTESNITPHEKINVGGKDAEIHTEAIKTNREIWRYLAIGAFFILLLEWYIYNRRAS